MNKVPFDGAAKPWELRRFSMGLLALSPLFLVGCPRPGLAPETDGETTTQTVSTTQTATTQTEVTECEPTTSQACYTGPAQTKGVGTCKDGTQTCSNAGAWGECEGEVLPAEEPCTALGTSPQDTNCDGVDPTTCVDPTVLITLSNPGFDVGQSIVTSQSGDLFWSGVIGPQTGTAHAFVKKLNLEGGEIWNNLTLAVEKQNQLNQIIEVGTSVYGVGSTLASNAQDTEGALLRLSEGGIAEGGVTLLASSGNDYLSAVAKAKDAAGGVFIVGTIGGQATLLGGGDNPFGDANDLFVMNIQADGFVPWNMVCFGETKAASPRALVHDVAHSRLYLGLTVAAPLAVPAATGGPVSIGVDDESDGYLFVIDPTKPDTAAVLRALAFRSMGADTVDGVAVRPDGTLFVIGTYSGTNLMLETELLAPGDADGKKDAFVAHIDEFGNILWVQRFGGPGDQAFHALHLAPDGLYVTGTEDSEGKIGTISIPHSSGRDFMIAKFGTTNGDLLWHRESQGAGNEWAIGITVDPKGRVWVTGDFSLEFSFDGQKTTANGDFDAFLLRVTP